MPVCLVLPGSAVSTAVTGQAIPGKQTSLISTFLLVVATMPRHRIWHRQHRSAGPAPQDRFFRCPLHLGCHLAAGMLVMLTGCADTTRLTIESLTLSETRPFPQSSEGKPVVISGELTLPSEATGRVPAVILAHGCGGFGRVQEASWTHELNRMGFASFSLDSFGGRGIREVCSWQEHINVGSRLLDAYRALEALAAHPRIDPSRIALMGFSHGGMVALWAHYTRFQRRWMSGQHRFAAYLSFYPAVCNFRFLDEDQDSRPLRIFLGADDDYNSVAQCQEYVERIRAAGSDVALLVYPDARHAFDAPELPPLQYLPQNVNSRACRYVERPDGSLAGFSVDTGRPVTRDAPCISRGTARGYNPRAHRQAIQDVNAFLNAAFGMTR